MLLFQDLQVLRSRRSRLRAIYKARHHPNNPNNPNESNHNTEGIETKTDNGDLIITTPKHQFENVETKESLKQSSQLSRDDDEVKKRLEALHSQLKSDPQSQSQLLDIEPSFAALSALSLTQPQIRRSPLSSGVVNTAGGEGTENGNGAGTDVTWLGKLTSVESHELQQSYIVLFKKVYEQLPSVDVLNRPIPAPIKRERHVMLGAQRVIDRDRERQSKAVVTSTPTVSPNTHNNPDNPDESRPTLVNTYTTSNPSNPSNPKAGRSRARARSTGSIRERSPYQRGHQSNDNPNNPIHPSMNPPLTAFVAPMSNNPNNNLVNNPNNPGLAVTATPPATPMPVSSRRPPLPSPISSSRDPASHTSQRSRSRSRSPHFHFSFGHNNPNNPSNPGHTGAGGMPGNIAPVPPGGEAPTGSEVGMGGLRRLTPTGRTPSRYKHLIYLVYRCLG